MYVIVKMFFLKREEFCFYSGRTTVFFLGKMTGSIKKMQNFEKNWVRKAGKEMEIRMRGAVT
jgi:hypothetical protein